MTLLVSIPLFKIIAYENYFTYMRASEDVFQMLILIPAVAFLTYVISFTTYQRKMHARGEWNSKSRQVLEVHKVGVDFEIIFPSHLGLSLESRRCH